MTQEQGGRLDAALRNLIKKRQPTRLRVEVEQAILWLRESLGYRTDEDRQIVIRGQIGRLERALAATTRAKRPTPGGVHNHGAEDGPGLACPEHLVGACRLAFETPLRRLADAIADKAAAGRLPLDVLGSGEDAAFIAALNEANRALAADPEFRAALAKRAPERSELAAALDASAEPITDRSGQVIGVRIPEYLYVRLRAALARADDVTYAEEADNEQDAERADAALDAALAPSVPGGLAPSSDVSGDVAKYGWHGNGDLCLGPECGVVDEYGDHPMADVHSNDWYVGYAAGQRDRAALAQRAPERSEPLNVERLREAVYNTAVGPDDCKTWGRIADIAAEYARLATAEQGAACICTPTVDGGHRAFCPARLQGEQE